MDIVFKENPCGGKGRMKLENWINSIHRESLKGETAYAYDQRLAKAA